MKLLCFQTNCEVSKLPICFPSSYRRFQLNSNISIPDLYFQMVPSFQVFFILVQIAKKRNISKPCPIEFSKNCLNFPLRINTEAKPNLIKNDPLGQLKRILGNLAPCLKFQFVTNGIFVFAAEPNYFGIDHYQTNLRKVCESKSRSNYTN